MVEKTEILKSAIHTFANLGIKRVSIDDLCFNLSISKKTFYHHYHEKQALINDFIAAEFQPIFEEYDRLKEVKSPLEIMIRFNQFLMELVRSKNPAVLYDLKQFYPENYEVYHEYRSKLMRAFQEILESGISSGHFRKEIDAKALAALRVSQLETILIPYPCQETQSEQYHQQVFEHYIYGIAGYLGMGRFPAASSN